MMAHPWAKYDKNPPRGSWDFAVTRFPYGRTDGQPENIMPPAPLRVGGINTISSDILSIKLEFPNFFWDVYMIRYLNDLEPHVPLVLQDNWNPVAVSDVPQTNRLVSRAGQDPVGILGYIQPCHPILMALHRDERNTPRNWVVRLF